MPKKSKQPKPDFLKKTKKEKRLIFTILNGSPDDHPEVRQAVVDWVNLKFVATPTVILLLNIVASVGLDEEEGGVLICASSHPVEKVEKEEEVLVEEGMDEVYVTERSNIIGNGDTQVYVLYITNDEGGGLQFDLAIPDLSLAVQVNSPRSYL
jgi:hypothetical protein